MSVSTIPAVYDKLTADLKLRTGLADVNIFSGPIPVQDAGLEAIVLGDTHETEDEQSMGGDRQEEYTIEGTIFVLKSGAGEEVIKAARDRAFALYGELESYLNDDYTLGGLVLNAEAKTVDVEQEYRPDGRVLWLDFEIQIMASKNP